MAHFLFKDFIHTATIPSGFSEYHRNETSTTKTQRIKRRLDKRVMVPTGVPNRLYLFFGKMQMPTQRKNNTILIVVEEYEQKEVMKEVK
jgi:hypothetical protein